jgi:tRNA-Thr(GGU) m(6)t(6)A37 methyltransferase TsaA
MKNSYSLDPIGVARTPFAQKFSIPRQSGLVAVPGRIELLPPYDSEQAFVGLDGVSHIWLSFIFHQHQDAAVKLSVRPPRLGGNKQIGVFACRSSFRPNALGLSLVKLERIERKHGKVCLHVSGIDVMDGTPIVDIKPYLPYADVALDAENALAPQKPQLDALRVTWLDAAEIQLQHLALADTLEFKQLVSQLVALDPRPAYKQDNTLASYGFCYDGIEVQWHCLGDEASIFQLTNIERE